VLVVADAVALASAVDAVRDELFEALLIQPFTKS